MCLNPSTIADSPAFVWPVRVYYEDTDAGGVVYHANYLKFLERARTERLRSLGFEQPQLRESEGVLFAVRSLEVDYLKPAYFNDALAVTADLAAVQRVSLTFRQKIFREGAGDEPCCLASVRVVCLSADRLRPIAMPDRLLESIRNVA
jgi:acyl-CoA thioester hydrolase